MSKCSEKRDFCGDYAFKVKYSEDNEFTMFFNSRRNAETVKRCIEVDDSVPNVATPVDFVEVVRCKDCIHHRDGTWCAMHDTTFTVNDYCSYGERRAK
ncbi:MAG: hypothetical protein IJE25_08240 [Clostridia bacterium]|nr:hypothetical protein [Clostridia bacterium]